MREIEPFISAMIGTRIGRKRKSKRAPSSKGAVAMIDWLDTNGLTLRAFCEQYHWPKRSLLNVLYLGVAPRFETAAKLQAIAGIHPNLWLVKNG